MQDAFREKPNAMMAETTAEAPSYRQRLPSRPLAGGPRRRLALAGPTGRRAFSFAAIALLLALALLYLPLSWPEAPQRALHPPEHGPSYQP
jgi:hypothetical protein